MNDYVFSVPIMGYQNYYVRANSEEEAKEKLMSYNYYDFNTPKLCAADDSG